MIEKDEINNQILLAALYSKDSTNKHFLLGQLVSRIRGVLRGTQKSPILELLEKALKA
jgi:DNA-binding response OmpR family regulator